MNTATSIPEARQRPSIQTEASPDQPNPGRMQHPNFRQSLFAQPPHPWDSNLRPLSNKLTSDLAQEARKLYDKWQDAIAYQTKVRDDSEAARQKSRESQQEVKDAISREADSHGKAKVLDAAQVKRREAIEAAESHDWRELFAQAQSGADSAKQSLANFYEANWKELVELHKADADRVHKEWVKAHKVLEPIEHEHDEIMRSLTTILSRVPGLTSNVLPDGYSEKPYLREQ